MPQAKRPAKGKRPNKAISVLGIAGVSWVASTGGSPAEMPAAFAAPTAGSVADLVWQNAAPFRVPTLDEEEISDVSLATFYVFDNENAGTLRRGVKIAAGGCGGCGGGGCGGCSTEPIDYGAPSLGSYANPPRYSTQPARIYAQAPKRRHVPK